VFRIATSDDDLRKCFIVRGIVFIEGQNCPYPEEVDEFEADAVHILGEIDGEPVAAARLRFLDDWVKLERIAVRQAWRGRNLGRRLVDFMLEVARTRGYRKFKMHAQTYLCDFYAAHGFRAVGEEFVEAGIDHYLMVREDG